ncbi:heavy-metal-associated domain-containing protein [Sporosarcina sp. G11-34]|uniref:heavy-metal-associated domain-containing protein n=1 Tax=Sporosarcina sp. G11-34 TaxID=2849605 RepID=UPI0022A93149|nr:heavy-metal-associated domain-containing protein [Sporosarcina sp. G11-34]MCZ2259319.1 cation transporter [Sporosarcina sp. G11-34]
MKKAVFGLEPLSCPTCIKKIESTVSKMNGVEDVKVLFNSNKVRTQFNSDVVNADQIQESIVKLGYPVISQKVS